MPNTATAKRRYHISYGCDGCDDEILIHNPQGEAIATVAFWNCDPDATASAEANAALIVKALNSYRRSVHKGASPAPHARSRTTRTPCGLPLGGCGTVPVRLKGWAAIPASTGTRTLRDSRRCRDP